MNRRKDIYIPLSIHRLFLLLPTQILPLEDQTLAKGHLLFSLFPWHDFDYAGELEHSNASRGLQVEKEIEMEREREIE